MQTNFENFSKFKILIGTILSVTNNEKARKPAYVLDIDFGNEVGVKKTSAQITNYKLSELEGRQVVAVSNFPSKNIAGVISEVLVLGAISKEGVKLLSLDEKVENGTIVG
ncbi:MAG: tRNA-binding protein [SAR116 cluster bacterium]|nr:tRNA-binding protein [SAR116 cluster bacterium]